MSNRVVVGYFVRRTWKVPPHSGETLFAETRQLYSTRKLAEAAARIAAGRWGSRFDLDVCEAWMHVDEDARAGEEGE